MIEMEKSKMDFNVNTSDVPFNEIAELTWDNGKLLLNGLELGLGLSGNSSATVGTLESVVSLATQPPRGNHDDDDDNDINVPRLDFPSFQPQHVSSPSVTDALVPCARAQCDGDGFTRANKGRRVDTCEKGSCGFGGAATASFWSLATTRDTNSVDDDLDESEACLTRSQAKLRSSDSSSPCYKRELLYIRRDTCKKEKKKGKSTSSSLLTKRSRAAALHNQSERKRRETINEKMKTLQKMVPNSSKTDKSSMLDEVIDYLKQLQAQVQLMISRMNIPSMMMPYAMPQHPFQMPIMPPMDTAMNMNMAHRNLANLAAPLVNPSTGFMPMVAGADHLSPSLVPVGYNNPSPYLAQSQSMSFDTYTRMIDMMQQQQLQQQQLDATKK